MKEKKMPQSARRAIAKLQQEYPGDTLYWLPLRGHVKIVAWCEDGCVQCQSIDDDTIHTVPAKCLFACTGSIPNT